MVKIAKMSTPKGAMRFEEAVSRTGFGCFNLFVLLAAGGSLMCVIIETMGMMFVIPAAKCDLDMNLFQKGLLSSITVLGVFTTSHLWGFIADTQGRRKVILISLCTNFLFSLASSMAPSYWLFTTLRYFSGVFIAGSSAIIYAFAGEFHDNTYRPKVVSWIASFVALGNIYLPGFAWLILPGEWSIALHVLFRPWRLLIIVYSLPCVLFAFLVFLLPESPKFLMSQGKHAEALEILQKIYAVNTRKSRKEYGVTELIWEEYDVVDDKKPSLFKSMWVQTTPLFKKPLLVKTIMVCCLQYGIFTSTSGVIMWYPEVLNEMAQYMEINPKGVTFCSALTYSNQEQNNILNSNDTQEFIVPPCTDKVNTEVFLISIVIGAANVMCYILIGSVINIIGKKTLLIGFLLITSIVGVAAQNVVGFTFVQILIGIFLLGASGISIINAIVVDIYPTQVRGMALAISLMFGRFGAVTGSNITGPLIYNLCDYVFYVFALDHVVLIIIVLLLPSAPFIQKTTEPI